MEMFKVISILQNEQFSRVANTAHGGYWQKYRAERVSVRGTSPCVSISEYLSTKAHVAHRVIRDLFNLPAIVIAQ